MDRNVVIATILIGAILIFWMYLIAPPPPDVPATGGPGSESQEEAQPPAVPEAEVQTERGLVAAPADTVLFGVADGEDRLITVDTDLYSAQFSTRGGTLVSLILKEYRKFDQETPVQLIDSTRSGAIALVFTTPGNHLVDTRSLYFSSDQEGDTVRVSEAGGSLSFQTTIGTGGIRQTYTFIPGEYEIGLEVAQVNSHTFSTTEGYELIWNGGIPLTEGDPQEEARGSGAYARSGGQVEYISLDSDAYQEKRLAGSVSWAAVKSKYFTAVMIPSGPTRGAELVGETVDLPTGGVWEDYTTRLLMPQPAAESVDQFRLYLGPMEFYRITDYGLGLYDMVDYGWDFFEWMTRPLAKFIFIPIFTFLSGFIPNYGIVIIIFGILIKIVLYPLTKTSYTSMARMRELQPKMEAIKEKYADNPQKQQEATMKMYKETGVNPLGGCLPMILQYPIIIALWLFLPQSIEIRQQGFLWAKDLSAPDVILNLPFTIPLYGNFVAGFTVLMGLSMVVQMKMQMTPSQNPQMKIMTYVFPIMIFAIFNRLAAGLSLYYLTYNIVTAIQQKYINAQIERKKDDTTPNGRGGKKDVERTGKGRSGRKVRSDK